MQRSLLVLLAVILLPIVATAQTTQVVEYYHTDAQGNVRAVTKQVDGQWQVVARYDYLPFGELFGQPSPPNQKRLFTGQERDFETGLDYFGARYFAASLGRFTTVDPGNASAALHDPQSWSAYAYGRNNPLRFIDLDGRTYQVCAAGAGCSFLSDAGWESAMGKAGSNYRIENGYMWALVNGRWTYAGFYEHISDDAQPITFGAMLQRAGELSAAGLTYGSIGMGLSAGAGALGGLAVGAFGGGIGAGSISPLAKNVIDPNKLIHIFANGGHNLAPLVARFGSQAAAYAAVDKATQGAVLSRGLSGVFHITLNVRGIAVEVTGKVIDGVARIGTFYIR
jgi:RHS repeat-associated protein